jgi:hypothetical protein
MDDFIIFENIDLVGFTAAQHPSNPKPEMQVGPSVEIGYHFSSDSFLGKIFLQIHFFKRSQPFFVLGRLQARIVH